MEDVNQRGVRQHFQLLSGQYDGFKSLTGMVSDEIQTLITQRLKTFSIFTQSSAKQLKHDDLTFLNELTSEANLVVENYLKWHEIQFGKDFEAKQQVVSEYLKMLKNDHSLKMGPVALALLKRFNLL